MHYFGIFSKNRIKLAWTPSQSESILAGPPAKVNLFCLDPQPKWIYLGWTPSQSESILCGPPAKVNLFCLDPQPKWIYFAWTPSQSESILAGPPARTNISKIPLIYYFLFLFFSFLLSFLFPSFSFFSLSPFLFSLSSPLFSFSPSDPQPRFSKVGGGFSHPNPPRVNVCPLPPVPCMVNL